MIACHKFQCKFNGLKLILFHVNWMLCGFFPIILKVNKMLNAGEATTSNSDLPPTYQEATNSRPTCSLYIREPLPPKYSDIFSDTQRS